ncbi:MAG: hypothetical protein JXK04_01360 [Campylobacterales bacterium]|nr:hypothetical protein [Campylobacterales bacterium]
MALSIAVVLHLLVFALIWVAALDFSDNEPPYREKRFGVLLSEEPDISKDVEPLPLPPAVPEAATAPGIPAPAADTVPLPEPERPSEAPTLQPITQADRHTLPRSVLHHYGEEFFDLSPGEQHYIIDNLQRIRKLNEIVGTRLLRERPDEEIDPSDSNVVEFYLHPDGTISDLHLQKNRIGTMLDELTLQTIALAHPRYPKPEQTTLVRIRVYILVK